MEDTEEISEEPEKEKGDIFSSLFRLAMWWKILYGVAKITFAFVLLKWATVDPSGLFYKLMANELIEDPNDLLIRFASPFIEHLSGGTTVFVAYYLLFWGSVDDVFLSINILLRRLWAFPIALTLIALFVPYEAYRLVHTHSFFLAYIIIVDIAVFALIAKEYGKQIHRKKAA